MKTLKNFEKIRYLCMPLDPDASLHKQPGLEV